MKLSTRLKLSYVGVFVLPVLLILLCFVGILRFTVSSMQAKYDLDNASYEMVFDPSRILGHVASSVTEELHETIAGDVDRLEDEAYLADVAERLSQSRTYLIVIEDGQTLYDNLPEDYPEIAAEGASEDGGSIYMLEELPFHIQQISFTYSDGAEGQILLLTDVDELMQQSGQLALRMVLLALVILFLGSALMLNWVYGGIVRPINNLKKAAENITEGNLNYSVTAESDDEIGELCTAFEQMRLKLKGQIERNIQSEKESKELISNISHDLKTPMTSIKGYVEGLLDGIADTPEKQEKYLRTIYNKVNDMNSLIEELFLYAKLDSNAVTYQFAKLPLDAYFQDCVDEIGLDLEAQGVDFGYYNYVDRETMIIADPEQLKRVINNIIGNSIKYACPDRKLSISLRLMEEAEYVKVEIEDNGRGIARKELPLIFDRLYRTDASRNSSKGGSGLGLSIARKIIEEHGGKIWAQSTEGQGTTMCFVLRKYKEKTAAE